MKSERFLALLAIVPALSSAGCAPYASVSSVRPRSHSVATLAPVERRISTALDQQRREPLEAVGAFLAAAQTAQEQLARDPANTGARCLQLRRRACHRHNSARGDSTRDAAARRVPFDTRSPASGLEAAKADALTETAWASSRCVCGSVE